MKSRLQKIANFFAFNCLFFALYLNFIHQDTMAAPPMETPTENVAFGGTILVESADQISPSENPTPGAASE